MVCETFFLPNSPRFWKSRGEGKDGENWQMQSVLPWKYQTIIEQKKIVTLENNENF